jgi:hypothetical protein
MVGFSGSCPTPLSLTSTVGGSGDDGAAAVELAVEVEATISTSDDGAQLFSTG